MMKKLKRNLRENQKKLMFSPLSLSFSYVCVGGGGPKQKLSPGDSTLVMAQSPLSLGFGI